MGASAAGMGNKAATSIIGGAVLLLLGYTINSMGDRYRASEAERDLKQVRAEIELSEKRMKELITVHKTAGPHDDVEKRLIILETRFQTILSELQEIKLWVKDDNGN